MLAAHQRNGTKGARTVAPLGDFQVSVVRGGREQTLPHQFLLVVGPEGFEQPRQLTGAKPRVHFRNALGQFVFVALRQTARHVDPLNLAFFFGLGPATNGVDALLLGRLDESAGVDHHDAGVVLLGLVLDFVIVGAQLGHHDFAVEDVFRAAQSHHVHLAGFEGSCSHALGSRDWGNKLSTNSMG